MSSNDAQATDVGKHQMNTDESGLSEEDSRPNALEVRELSVHYGPLTAVAEVSFTVAPGEIVAILGPSGSGKSSLLRGLAGLEPATGDVLWAGTSVMDIPAHRREFVVMFQDGQLFPHLNVAGNIAYGLAGSPRSERDQRVTELLNVVGLDGFGLRPITALSGGQAQRVALARSLAPKPRLLLLDEPLSSLDRALREHLTGVLSDALRTTATTALYVTHDQDEAFAIADRIGIMMDGRLKQFATPNEVWQHPVDRAVAAFLGYGPFLNVSEAARLGAHIPDGHLLALGPRSLVTVADGHQLPVVATRTRRDGIDLTVRLDTGQEATVHEPATAYSSLSARPSTLAVWLDPSTCAILTAAPS